MWLFGKKKQEVTPNNAVTMTQMESWADFVANGGGSSFAGPTVNDNSAMNISAVYACVRIIAGAIASMPIDIKETGTNKLVKEHRLASILNDQPSDMMTASVFWETTMRDMLLPGDSIALIERSYGGDALGLYHVPSRSVSVERKNGRLRYGVSLSDGGKEFFDQDDVLHIPCMGLKNNRGVSPLSHARQAMGIALAGEEFAGRFFSNGGALGGYIKFAGKVTPEQANEIREWWSTKQKGLANAHKPAVFSEGGEFVPVTLSAEDAQLLESRSFSVEDICRFYGVPPWMVGSTQKTTSWGSGIEQQFLGFLTMTMTPHLTRIEQELNRKLLKGTGLRADFNSKGMLRGDIKTRFDGYKVARGGNQEPGFMTVNEIRALEGLEPLPEGNVLYHPASDGAKKKDNQNDGQN